MDSRALRGALLDALDLVTPTACAGCGCADRVLCDDCAADLFTPPRRVDPDAPLLAAGGPPTWAVATYRGPTRELVLAWKRGRRDLQPLVAHAVAEMVDRWLTQLPDAVVELPGPIAVVPAPSGWVRRARGLLVAADVAEVVAHALCAGLADGGAAGAPPAPAVLVADVLRRPGLGHLAGLSAAARASARSAARLRVRRPPTARTWVLVDDVVTTGATLHAAAGALEESTGAPVTVAFALAATPRRSGAGGLRM